MKHSKAYVRLLLDAKYEIEYEEEEESRHIWNDVIWEMAWVADDMDTMADILEMWED